MRGEELSKPTVIRVLTAFVALLAALTLFHLGHEPDHVASGVLELSILGGLTLLVGGAVYRVREADVDDEYGTILRSCATGVVFLLLLSFPSVIYFQVPATGHEALFIYQLAGSIGGLGGLLAGMHEARAVTEARETERTEAERQRLEYLNQLLRHDVLNNLTVIDGNLELALEVVEDDTVRTRLRTARRQAHEATDHIQNVRALVQSAREGHSLEPIDLGAVVDREVSQLRETYPEAEFDVTVPEEATVEADQLLGSVVENLVRNAVEHNDGTPQVRVTVERTNGTVALEVADNGPGIPPEVLSSLAEPPESGDHGLGLPLVYMLVDRYGGELNVPRSDSSGTTVRVELPAA